MAEGEHDGRAVRISRGKGFNLGKAKNQVLPWAKFCDLFKKPTRTKESFKAYLKAPLAERNRLKSIDGWYLGAPIKGKTRNNSAIEDRDILTLDLDRLDPADYELIKAGVRPICRYEFVAHTTRSHSVDKPRLRINLVLAGPLDRERFMPVARITGHYIDPSMNTVDPVSYRLAQMMFMPTVSRDQPYDCFRNHGELLDPDSVLEAWESDWSDYKNLPYAESEEIERKKERKAEDPFEKPGPIGAFCRAYPIEDAISEFLSDVYGNKDPHSRQPRYTFLGGHAMYGVVVYDDGRFTYSHHGTDPAGDKLLNSFDLVRVHKFGDKDEGEDDKNITDLPSYKAMLDFVKKDRNVQKQQIRDELDIEAMFDEIPDMDEAEIETAKTEFRYSDLDAEALAILGMGDADDPTENVKLGLPPYPGVRKPRKPKKDWVDDLEPGQTGGIKATVYNVAKIVGNDPRLWGAIAFNNFTSNLCSRREIKVKLDEVPRLRIEDPEDGSPWTDNHDAAVKIMLSAPRGRGQTGYGLTVADNTLDDAIRSVAQKFAFHPVVDRLLGLEWDGTPRADAIWIDYLGTPDTPYHRETARQFLLGAVARIFCPGHKFDFVPVFSGLQGKRKTTFVEVLAFDKWGKEFSAPLDNQQLSAEQMMGAWILEMAEIVNIRKSDIETQKAFITRKMDRVRLSYDRRMSELKRQCVFIGTTNEFEYLRDAENRRFWPMTVNVEDHIDTERLRSERDQIWAEVMVWYREACSKHDYRRIPFGLSGAALVEALALQGGARLQTADDTDLATIEAFLERPLDLQDYLEDDDGTTDLDAENPTILRTTTCVEQLLKEALGEDPPKGHLRNTRCQLIGQLARRIEGWVTYAEWCGSGATNLKVRGYHRSRGYVRADATNEEIARGYRIIDDGEPVDDVL